jgi:AmmeMemoRadiSam system protein B
MDEMQLGPTVAGSWYPGQRASLERQIDALLSAGGGEDAAAPEGRIVALIVPHAGLVYSGSVAGSGFRRIKDRTYEKVVLIGPSHHAFFQGAAVPGATHYSTPLGQVLLDRDAIAALVEKPGIESDDRPFLPEHCLEMEIPFLQRALVPGWRLVPLLIGGGSSPAGCDLVARALEPLMGPGTLIVVSTDFTHYGPRFSYVPFTTDVPGQLRDLDMGAVEKILESDRNGFTEYVKRTGATICGRNAIEVLLSVLPQPIEGSLLAYDTSGNITGEWDHSVSYASLEFQTGC